MFNIKANLTSFDLKSFRARIMQSEHSRDVVQINKERKKGENCCFSVCFYAAPLVKANGTWTNKDLHGLKQLIIKDQILAGFTYKRIYVK